MIRIVDGKNIVQLTDLEGYISGYNSIEVDVGTGEGKFIYTKAQQNPEIFYIGIDPVAENMYEYSSKAKKKSSKTSEYRNVLYVVAAVENLPSELNNVASKIYVTLPWGSLLEGIAKADSNVLKSLRNMAKTSGSQFEFCFTYDTLYEPSEIKNRGLPELNISYVEIDLRQKYKEHGFLLEDSRILSAEELRKYPTKWARKLGFGRGRAVYLIKGTIDS